VNFNPLLKLERYFMFSDYLEIPILLAKSMNSPGDWVG